MTELQEFESNQELWLSQIEMVLIDSAIHFPHIWLFTEFASASQIINLVLTHINESFSKDGLELSPYEALCDVDQGLWMNLWLVDEFIIALVPVVPWISAIHLREH